MSTESFKLLVCADLRGTKVNLEVSFGTCPPSFSALKEHLEAVFAYETHMTSRMYAQGEEGSMSPARTNKNASPKNKILERARNLFQLTNAARLEENAERERELANERRVQVFEAAYIYGWSDANSEWFPVRAPPAQLKHLDQLYVFQPQSVQDDMQGMVPPPRVPMYEYRGGETELLRSQLTRTYLLNDSFDPTTSRSPQGKLMSNKEKSAEENGGDDRDATSAGRELRSSANRKANELISNSVKPFVTTAPLPPIRHAMFKQLIDAAAAAMRKSTGEEEDEFDDDDGMGSASSASSAFSVRSSRTGRGQKRTFMLDDLSLDDAFNLLATNLDDDDASYILPVELDKMVTDETKDLQLCVDEWTEDAMERIVGTRIYPHNFNYFFRRYPHMVSYAYATATNCGDMIKNNLALEAVRDVLRRRRDVTSGSEQYKNRQEKLRKRRERRELRELQQLQLLDEAAMMEGDGGQRRESDAPAPVHLISGPGSSQSIQSSAVPGNEGSIAGSGSSIR